MAEPLRRPPLPQRLVDQAQAYADGTATPAEPRLAATVLLLRPGSSGDGSDVYLLRRQTSMAFAGGMYVFPGGGVDPRDSEQEISWTGPSPAEWSERLGTDEPTARALVCAAVRETFEESGVLLAGPAGTSEVVADTSGDEWEVDRAALEAHELAFSDMLARRGLTLRTDLLGAWSAWCTPVFEPKRYRTWFFVALLPEGQVTRDVSSESASVTWTPTAEALAAAQAGEVAMMPPTWFNILDADRAGDPAAALAEAAGRSVEVFTPEVVCDGDEWRLTSPPGFDETLAER